MNVAEGPSARERELELEIRFVLATLGNILARPLDPQELLPKIRDARELLANAIGA